MVTYSFQQHKTVSTNSPWAYIRDGLLLEGFLRLRFGGLYSGGFSFGELIRWAWLLSNQTISCFTNRIPMREKIPANHKRKDQ